MYDMEKIVEQLINKLQNIKIDDIKIIDNKYILNKYNDKKIIHLLTRLLDLAEKKKWILQETDNDTFIIVDIGFIKIQQKKILISTNNDITFTLNLGKDQENLENLEYINKL